MHYSKVVVALCQQKTNTMKLYSALEINNLSNATGQNKPLRRVVSDSSDYGDYYWYYNANNELVTSFYCPVETDFETDGTHECITPQAEIHV